MLDFGFYNMDCMDGMKEFPDKYFDLAIVDPPYGINATSFANGSGLKDHSKKESTSRRVKKERLNHGGGKLKKRALNSLNCDWDSNPPGGEYFDELFRVSKNQIIWGGNYFTYKEIDGIKCGLPPKRGIVVWDKKQPWENYSQVEIAWTSFDCTAKIFRYRNTNDNGKIHPTQKPIALYEWLIEKFAKPNDILLDTHVGSASSLIAFKKNGFQFVGFEKDEYYYKTALERFQNETAQITITDLLMDKK